MREILTPSSSSSALAHSATVRGARGTETRLTDVVRLDLDSLLQMSFGGTARRLVIEDDTLAERVDERGASSPRLTCSQFAGLVSDFVTTEERDLPVVMMVNCSPFFTAFRRGGTIFDCAGGEGVSREFLSNTAQFFLFFFRNVHDEQGITIAAFQKKCNYNPLSNLAFSLITFNALPLAIHST